MREHSNGKNGVKCASPITAALLGRHSVLSSPRNRIRAKVAGKGAKRRGAGAGGTSSLSASKKPKTSSGKRADKLAGAAERAPDPPYSSLSEEKLAEIEIKTNRSPVMVLWATVRFEVPYLYVQWVLNHCLQHDPRRTCE